MIGPRFDSSGHGRIAVPLETSFGHVLQTFTANNDIQ
jgi:hypothetical protein